MSVILCRSPRASDRQFRRNFDGFALTALRGMDSPVAGMTALVCPSQRVADMVLAQDRSWELWTPDVEDFEGEGDEEWDLSVLDGTIDDLEELLDSEDNPLYVQALLDGERAGKGRVGAIEALEDWLEDSLD